MDQVLESGVHCYFVLNINIIHTDNIKPNHNYQTVGIIRGYIWEKMNNKHKEIIKQEKKIAEKNRIEKNCPMTLILLLT